VLAHCRALIDRAGPACVAVKPQLACFERLGAPGWAALERVCAAARDAGLLVVADGKRGDVPVTASAYAQALVGETPTPWGAVPGLGADAFKTKYGATETFGACVKAHATGTGDTKHTATKKPAGVTLTIAQALCSTEAKSIGRDAFQAKYGAGSSGLGACVKAQATNAVAIAVACKASFGGSGDAFKQCVLAALKTARSR